MRQVALAALVVLVLGGCSGDGGDSSPPPADPGPFVPAGPPTTTGRFLPTHLAVGWFDGDAYPDVALTDGIHPEVRVMLGAADGSFTLLAPLAFGIPADPDGLAAGFFNFDAFADLVVIGRGGGHNVLLGNGDGTFVPLHPGIGGIVPGAAAAALVSADLNGDFFTDVVYGTFDGRLSAAGGSGSGMLLGLGGQFLQTMSPLVAVAAANVDNDPDLDLVGVQQDTTLSALEQTGGGFIPIGNPLAIGGTPRGMVAGRFDLMPADDIAVIDGVGAQVRFISGALGPPFQTIPLPANGFAIAVEPRLTSMRDAIVVTTLNATFDGGMLLRIAFDETAGAFVATPIANAPAFPTAVAFADMNLDSAPDLIVASFDPLVPAQGFLQTFFGTGQ